LSKKKTADPFQEKDDSKTTTDGSESCSRNKRKKRKKRWEKKQDRPKNMVGRVGLGSDDCGKPKHPSRSGEAKKEEANGVLFWGEDQNSKFE